MPQIDQWLEAIRDYRRVALDTNTVIYLLEGVAPYSQLVQHLFRLMERGLVIGTISTIVEAEVLVKPLRERDQATLHRTEVFFGESPNMVIRGLDRAVARRAALIRASARLRLADAIIVATALEERCDAIVGNDGTMAQQVTSIPYLYLENFIARE